MSALLLAATLVLSTHAPAQPGELVLQCRLCDGDRPVLVAAGLSREQDIERRIERIERQIASTSRRWPAGAVGLGIAGGCVTLVSPLLMVAGIMMAVETGIEILGILGLASVIVGPIVLVGAVAWGAISVRNNQRRIQDLQEERSMLHRELRDIRRDRDDLPAAPMVPVAMIRF